MRKPFVAACEHYTIWVYGAGSTSNSSCLGNSRRISGSAKLILGLKGVRRTEQHAVCVRMPDQLRHRSTAHSLSRTRPKACVGAMRWFRRKHDQPWEVVGCEIVDPVLMFDETGGSHPPISRNTL